MAAPVVQSVSAAQRDSSVTYLVDVGFSAYDPDSATLSYTVSYSLDAGATWALATQQQFDRRDTAGAGLSGVPPGAPGKNFVFVWNAFEDLPSGVFDVSVMVVVDDGANQDSAVTPSFSVLTLKKETSDKTGLKRQLNRSKGLARGRGAFLGNGLRSPFIRGASDFVSSSGVDLVRASVRQILGTRAAVNGMAGELPWNPAFGFKFWALKHEPNNDILSDIILSYVQDALVQEPRAEAISATAIAGPDNTKIVRVKYSVITRNTASNQVEIPTFEEDIPVLG